MARTDVFVCFLFKAIPTKTKQRKKKLQQHPFYTWVVYRLGDLNELNAQKRLSSVDVIVGDPVIINCIPLRGSS